MLRFNNQVVFQRRIRLRTIARAGTDLRWNRAGSLCGERLDVPDFLPAGGVADPLEAKGNRLTR